MPHYIRPRVTGATIFFTVCLQDRRSALLTEQIGLLRDAVRATKAGRPFEIVSMVVLPDHLHCVWRLPAGDRDFGRRWGAIKGRFSASVRRAGVTPPPWLAVVRNGWQGEPRPTSQISCASTASAQAHPPPDDVFCPLHSPRSCPRTTQHGLRPQKRGCACKSGRGRSGRAR